MVHWKEYIQTARKRLKVLSVHRMSSIFLLVVSVGLFLTVLFVALPSARIKVWPRVSLVSHTANILLISSGATLNPESADALSLDRKHKLPLLPIKTNVNRSLTFDEISKKFMGENAEVEMTIVNESDEPYELRGGTRLVNQAGMIFKTLDPVKVPSKSIVEPGVSKVRARATPEDLYGQITGDRGNVPAGLKWEIPGLPLEERKVIYARNSEPAIGGITLYGNQLQEKDLELAKKQLEQELLRTAKVRTEDEVEILRSTGKYFTVLQYDVLTAVSFSGFVMPLDLIGQPVKSIPVEGGLSYAVLAYDKNGLLDILMPGILSHVDDGQELMEKSIMKEGISVHVIEYDDYHQWVKITAELTGKQRAILSPVSPTGRAFGERAREMIQGKSVSEAERIVQNFPEVDRVEVKVWPPWRRGLPSLVSNIVLLPQE